MSDAATDSVFVNALRKSIRRGDSATAHLATVVLVITGNNQHDVLLDELLGAAIEDVGPFDMGPLESTLALCERYHSNRNRIGVQNGTGFKNELHEVVESLCAAPKNRVCAHATRVLFGRNVNEPSSCSGKEAEDFASQLETGLSKGNLQTALEAATRLASTYCDVHQRIRTVVRGFILAGATEYDKVYTCLEAFDLTKRYKRQGFFIINQRSIHAFIHFFSTALILSVFVCVYAGSPFLEENGSRPKRSGEGDATSDASKFYDEFDKMRATNTPIDLPAYVEAKTTIDSEFLCLNPRSPHIDVFAHLARRQK
jgi:hypothetical protein